MKKLLSVILAVSLTLSLTACGVDTSEENSPPLPPDLSGQWRQINNETEDSYQGAIIEDDVIEIYWVSNGGDTRSLYWSGTFEAPDTDEEPYAWESEKDEARTEHSIMSSGDDTKTFTYENGQISYSASIMGTTSKIRLEKKEWEPGLEIKKDTEGSSSSDEPSTGDDNIESYEAATFPFIAAGVEFAVPSYYESIEIEDTEGINWFDTYDNDRKVAILGFYEENVPTLTQEGIDNYFDSILEEISNDDDFEIKEFKKKDDLIAGFSGRAVAAEWTTEGAILSMYISFAYNSRDGKIIYVMFAPYIQQADNYIEDYNKMIETARLVDTEAPSNTSNDTPTPSSGIRPEFKEVMDSYETFFDEYIAFMERYANSDNPLSLLTDYSNYMKKYTETMTALSQINDGSLSTEELAYYVEVQSRITQKLLTIAQ